METVVLVLFSTFCALLTAQHQGLAVAFTVPYKGCVCDWQVHARAHLPSLEDKNGVHVEVIDTYGTRHRFRYCSWINNSSRMYLLEGVAPALVASPFSLFALRLLTRHRCPMTVMQGWVLVASAIITWPNAAPEVLLDI